MTVVYHCVEGVITTLLAKQYNREFTLGMGITNAFLCSFYRVATLGSGAGVAAIVYLGEHGIEYSRSFGLYMLQSAFHKISIAFFSMILFTLNWNYMRVHFGEYMWLLLAGYLITLIITVVLILFSCSRQFGWWISSMERRKGGLIRRQQCFMTSARCWRMHPDS